MQPDALLHALKTLFTPAETARVLAGLQEDSLVWSAFEQSEFCLKAQNGLGSRLENWCPGGVSLVALGLSAPEAGLAQDPIAVLDSALRQNAVRCYEDTRRKMLPPVDLNDAGLLALALRERRRVTGGWAGMLEELLKPGVDAQLTARTWRTSLALLGGLVPDYTSLLKCLMKARPESIAVDWGMHMVLCSSWAEKDQAALLADSLKGLSTDMQLTALKLLRGRGRTALAEQVATLLVTGHPVFTSLRTRTDLDSYQSEALAGRALTLQQMGTLYQFSGSPAQADACFRRARTVLDTWKTGLQLQGASLNLPESDGELSAEQVMQQIIASAAPSGKFMEEVGGVLVAKADLAANLNDSVETADTPFYLLARAKRAAGAGEVNLAHELAEQAAEKFINSLQDHQSAWQGEFVHEWNIPTFLKGLVELGVTQPVVHCVEAAVEARPADSHLYQTASQIMLAKGLTEKAYQFAQIATSLNPTEANWLRSLCKICEQAGLWNEAFEEWKKLLKMVEPAGLDDRMAFIRAALEAGYAQESADACQAVLEENPDQGEAHGLLGKALATLGSSEEAAAHLSRATLLCPEEAEWWLQLAGYHQKMGDERMAVDTLRAAVMAAPESGDVHLALGKSLVKDALASEALPYLRQAFTVMPDNQDAGLALSKTLHSLGHLTEARNVMDSQRSLWAKQPEMAFEYASVALDSGDLDGAIPALDIAVHADQALPEWYLVYARILLEEDQLAKVGSATIQARYAEAEQMLASVLGKNPDDEMACFLLAEAQRKMGDHAKAKEFYQQLSERPGGIAADLRWKVLRGFGLSALATGQIESALASLKEAAAAKPGELTLQHELAQAYKKARLSQDAAQAAETALQIAPDDVENLDWFAAMMMDLGRTDRAENALSLAADLAPERAGLLVRLSQLQLESGNTSGARQSLELLQKNELAGEHDLRQSAYLYLRMTDVPQALVCLEKAYQMSENPTPDLMFDLGKLYEQTGRLSDAFEVIQKAVGTGCEDVQLFIFQSDILSRLNRSQAAQASLEHALHAAETGAETCRDSLMMEIHRRMARLLRQMGNLSGALQEAEKAVVYAPQDSALRIDAADLSAAMIQDEKARKLCLTLDEVKQQGDFDKSQLYMVCLQAELELDARRTEEARALLEAVRPYADQEAWVIGIEARIAAQQGEMTRSVQLAQDLLAKVAQTPEYDLTSKFRWVAKAALDACLWNEAMRQFETYIQKAALEPRAHLELAKALVICAEMQRTCQELSCKVHAPGAAYLSSELQARFEQAIDQANRLNKSVEVERWQARGMLVFDPSAEAVKTFARFASLTEDSPALVGGLRASGNRQAAIQIARSHGDSADTALQMVLCYLDGEAERGVELAEKLVEKNPLNPLNQAALAILAHLTGDEQSALQSAETALSIWPDEPDWHALAGEAAVKCGESQVGVEHWMKALNLEPDRVDYSRSVGKVLLLTGDTQQAIEVLERASRLDPNDAEVWMGLAQARKAGGALNEAMEASLKASEIDPGDVNPVLLSSAIAQSMGELDLASEYAHLALRRDPSNPKVVLALSRVLQSKGKVEEGLAVIEQSLPGLAESLPVQYERAWLVYRLKGGPAASGLVNKLAQSYPEDAQTLGLLAQVQSECGDVKSAEKSAFKSLKLDPGQPALTMMLGRLERKTGQLDQAVHLLSEAIRMRPNDVEAYLELGQAYLDRREHLQALQIYRQATRVAPRDSRPYYFAALILRDSKDYVGAEAMLQQAAKLSPDDLLVRRQLVGVMALNLIHKSQEASTAL